MSESVFVSAGGRFLPTEHARGPWDPCALHGGAPAALITAAFERMQPGAASSPEGELRIARLGFEFLRPIPLAPLKLTTRIVRPGRRVQELTAELSVLVDDPHGDVGGPDDGAGVEQVVCRASALRVRAVPSDLSLPAEPDSHPPAPESSRGPTLDAPAVDGAMGTPEAAEPLLFSLDGSSGASFATSAMEMRTPGDSHAPGEARAPEDALALGGSRPPGHARALGPGRVWMRLRPALVAGEQPTPLARLAASADFGNGISAALPFDRYLFINADLAIHLQRQPRGEWIGLDARTLLHPGGTGLAESVLHDVHGPVGRAFQTLVVERR